MHFLIHLPVFQGCCLLSNTLTSVPAPLLPSTNAYQSPWVNVTVQIIIFTVSRGRSLLFTYTYSTRVAVYCSHALIVSPSCCLLFTIIYLPLRCLGVAVYCSHRVTSVPVSLFLVHIDLPVSLGRCLLFTCTHGVPGLLFTVYIYLPPRCLGLAVYCSHKYLLVSLGRC